MASDTMNYFGTPIEEYPEPCRTCPRLAAWVLHYGNPDLSKRPSYPFPSDSRHTIARAVFPRLDKCSAINCGLAAYALQSKHDLE